MYFSLKNILMHKYTYAHFAYHLEVTEKRRVLVHGKWTCLTLHFMPTTAVAKAVSNFLHMLGVFKHLSKWDRKPTHD